MSVATMPLDSNGYIVITITHESDGLNYNFVGKGFFSAGWCPLICILPLVDTNNYSRKANSVLDNWLLGIISHSCCTGWYGVKSDLGYIVMHWFESQWQLPLYPPQAGNDSVKIQRTQLENLPIYCLCYPRGLYGLSYPALRVVWPQQSICAIILLPLPSSLCGLSCDPRIALH